MIDAEELTIRNRREYSHEVIYGGWRQRESRGMWMRKVSVVEEDPPRAKLDPIVRMLRTYINP